MTTLPQNYRILVVDDNPAIHRDVRKILNASKTETATLDDAESILSAMTARLPRGGAAQKDFAQEFELEFASQGKEGFELVQQACANGRPYAMAFVDVRMPPGWDGIETITHMWQVQPDLQIVICTAYSDYSWDDIIAKLGHSDSLVILKKPFDNIEVLQLAHSMTKKWLVTQQANLQLEKLNEMVRARTAELETANAQLRLEIADRAEAQEALRLSEERFSKAFQASPIALAIQNLHSEYFADVNESFVRMTGFSRKELVGHTPMELHLCVDFESRVWGRLREEKSVRNVECQISTKGGDLRKTLLSMELFTLGSEPHVLMIAQDITDRLQLEQELRQAQKMEAVGQLAAGVAHDFNNVLTVIQGHASMQLMSGDLDRDIQDSLKQMASAAERAAMLTRQLLAFSRKQIMHPRRLCLNDLITDLAKMMPRLIGEHLELKTSLAPGLPAVLADACNMEQILINFAVNARDAMPRGGSIAISTREIFVDEKHLQRVPEATAGRYVCVSVSDTGSGMDTLTKSRIFEPFFTTKEVGKGTGMGLATVYGIVKQHDGWIEVESELGQGTAFHVLLPACEQPVERKSTDPALFFPRPFGQNRTVLVVEDDAAVRGLVKEILIHYGCRVLEAASGSEAIAIAEARKDEITLLLTDMVMPGGMSGRELATHLLAAQPGLKVVYTSGYSTDLFSANLDLRDGVNYLPKPYTSNLLASVLRENLDTMASPAGKLAEARLCAV